MGAPRRLSLLAALSAAAFALVFAFALAFFAFRGDGETPVGEAAPGTTGPRELPAASGTDRIVVAIPGPRPPESYLHVVTIDGSARRQLTSVAASGLIPIDTNPEWAPDGRRIAFVRSLETPSGGGGEPAHVYTVPARGGEARRLVSGEAAEAAPTWSPDARWIAFARETPRGFAIFTARAGGTQLGQLTRAGPWTDAVDPAWAPDGRSIAFTAYVNDNQDLYVVDRAGLEAASVLAGPTRDSQPAWSPDGRRLAFIRDGDVYTTEVEGTDLRRVAGGPGEALDPSWSPDGRRILFTNGDGQVVIVQADGTAAARVPLGATPTGASWERRP